MISCEVSDIIRCKWLSQRPMCFALLSSDREYEFLSSCTLKGAETHSSGS